MDFFSLSHIGFLSGYMVGLMVSNWLFQAIPKVRVARHSLLLHLKYGMPFLLKYAQPHHWPISASSSKPTISLTHPALSNPFTLFPFPVAECFCWWLLFWLWMAKPSLVGRLSRFQAFKIYHSFIQSSVIEKHSLSSYKMYLGDPECSVHIGGMELVTADHLVKSLETLTCLCSCWGLC